MEDTPTPVTTTVQTPIQNPMQTPAQTKPKKIPVAGNNRTLLLIFVAAVILGSAYGYRNLFVAATIDGASISRLDVVRKLEKSSGKAVLDGIITERLIAKEASRAAITINQADIDKQIDDIKTQVTAQGMTIEEALEREGLTLEDVQKQIRTQLELKKILGDKLAVSDTEIDDYLTKSKLTPPKDMDATTFRNRIRDQLSNQKFGTEADNWIKTAREKAKIEYLVDYAKPLQTAEAPKTSTEPATPPTTP